jgi:hypothetical protein
MFPCRYGTHTIRTTQDPTIHTHKGAIGFDGDGELVAAYRGAQAHVKTRVRLIANDNAIALAA